MRKSCVVLVLSALTGCAAPTRAARPDVAAPTSATAPPPSVAPPPTLPTPSTTEPSAPPAASNEPAESSTPACPEDMVLVDGDYCTDVELRCLRSTYAPQNKKTICHEFASPSRCVGEKVKKRYCIDRYEFPNRAGERPKVMLRFAGAQAACAERGRRLCTESEWTMACEGPSYKPYPYGYARDPKKCNGDRPYVFPDMGKVGSRDPKLRDPEVERLWQGVPSGTQPDCVSDYGVHDLPGNADELATSETPAPRSKFDNVTTGGPWLEGVRNQCRPKIYTHDEGFYYYYLSFRCCAEPDGKPTDPRSPKQIARGEAYKPPKAPPAPKKSASRAPR